MTLISSARNFFIPERPEKIEEILAVRREADKVTVLGITSDGDAISTRETLYRITLNPRNYEILSDERFGKPTGSMALLLPTLGLVYLLPPVRRKLDQYWSFEDDKKQHYQNYARDVERVPLYQLTFEGAQQELGSLVLVDTGSPRKFIEGSNDFQLRAWALELDADAIVHYQAASPPRGTPVKLKYSKDPLSNKKITEEFNRRGINR